MEGDAGVVEGASALLLWKRLLTSNLAVGLNAEVEGVSEEDAAAEVEVGVDVDATEGGVPVENEVVREWTLPFVFAGTEPKDLIPSGFIVGTAAGEEDMGAEASSMDPKVTDEPGACETTRGGARGEGDAPDFVALVGVRAPTPSLNDTPCPNVLGRLEWAVGAEGVDVERVYWTRVTR